MTSQTSTSVFDSLYTVNSLRPTAPGCGGIVGNELSAERKSSFVSDLSHSVCLTNSSLSTSLTVTSPTSENACCFQEPDGCSFSATLCQEISEPGSSKMDNLTSLLHNHHGITFFRRFLSAKHACDILEFWLACVGYQKIDAAKCLSTAMVIYKTFVAPASNRVKLAGSTRRAVRERLKSGCVDHTLFDGAVTEVQLLMLRDYYPEFLESDIYAEYVRTRSSNQSPSSDDSSGHSSTCCQSQTVDADDSAEADKLCRNSFPACKVQEDLKTCNSDVRGGLSPTVCCTGYCVAQTGYDFFCFGNDSTVFAR